MKVYLITSYDTLLMFQSPYLAIRWYFENPDMLEYITQIRANGLIYAKLDNGKGLLEALNKLNEEDSN